MADVAERGGSGHERFWQSRTTASRDSHRSYLHGAVAGASAEGALALRVDYEHRRDH